MANYFLTNKAIQDRSEIYEYTYKFWPEAQAEKYYLEITDFCQTLCENPNIEKKIIPKLILSFSDFY